MRADRLLAIMLILQTRGKMTAQLLAKEVGVSIRTILRDVEALSLAGIPIYAEGGHGGGIALDENYRTTLTGLKESELRTLFVAGTTRLLYDIGLGEAAESTQRKLSAALPLQHQSTVDQVHQRLYVDPVWWWHDPSPMAFYGELQRAVFEDRLVEVVYEHYDGEQVKRVLAPYSLVAKASHWYLIAERDDEFRMYRLSRFYSITVKNEHFQRREDFDLVTYWHENAQRFADTITAYILTLRVHENRLKFVQWLVSGRYEVLEEPTADGWLTVRLRLESMELAKMLVFGLGHDAVVIEPHDLHEAVLNDARQLLEKYAPNNT
ncbi:MAG: YafY family transcriptional regulator [Chloroflexi bacterium]|nr:YafY family transcriptional regulator [Chloroflexota bacterium]